MDYQKEAMKYTQPVCKNWNNVGLGLTGEAGNICQMIKKYMFQGEMLDKNKMIEELGVLCWYVALACEQLGVSFDTILANNITKLSSHESYSVSKYPYYDNEPDCPYIEDSTVRVVALLKQEL